MLIWILTDILATFSAILSGWVRQRIKDDGSDFVSKSPDYVGSQTALDSRDNECLLTTGKSIVKMNWNRFL